MDTATMSGSVLRILIFLVSLRVGSAENSSCVVAAQAKQTAYNITKMPDVSHLELCEYSWTNATKYVFAHNLDEDPELVLSKSVSTLVTSWCINHIILSLDCITQGRFIYHCFCNCSERAALEEDKGLLTETSNPWMYVIVPIVILVLMLLCFLLYRYRDDISRRCNSYTSGKRSSVDQPIV